MVDGFVPVTRASELSPGAMKWVVIDRERVLLANVDGAFYALQDACGHRGASLARGRLVGHVIECPLHFACFDVSTGKLMSGPTAADIPTYPVRVEEDIVYVKRSPNPGETGNLAASPPVALREGVVCLLRAETHREARQPAQHVGHEELGAAERELLGQARPPG